MYASKCFTCKPPVYEAGSTLAFLLNFNHQKDDWKKTKKKPANLYCIIPPTRGEWKCNFAGDISIPDV